MNYNIEDLEIKEILDALQYCIFDEDLDYTNDSFYDNIAHIFKEHYNKPFKAFNGCSKGVLAFKELGFVIKIPFNYCDGYELCAVQEGNNEWDYCSQEANRYNMAVEADVEEAFLPTKYLTNIDGYPIYIQPYAEILENLSYEQYHEKESKSSKEERENIESLNDENNFYHINSIWEAEFFKLHGFDYFMALKNFIKKHFIRDLRAANIGYWNGKPVLIDYASFDE